MAIKLNIEQFYALADDIIIKPHRTDEELDIIKIESGRDDSIIISLKSGEKFLITNKGETVNVTQS